MGADGNIIILDATIVEQHGYNPQADFTSAYRREIFGRGIWTVYYDTEHIDLYHSYGDPTIHRLEDYESIGAVIDDWEVWT